MASSWRPETVDPLGQVWGAPAKQERKYSYWLDLRTSDITFAQMVVMKLFYAVRRVVDEAGTSLPKGSAVEGLLFDELRYDRADTIGQDLPIFVETTSGIVNATVRGPMDSYFPAEIRTPTSVEELSEARDELESLSGSDVTTAIVLSADPMLWATALTGLRPDQLVCLEANEGA